MGELISINRIPKQQDTADNDDWKIPFTIYAEKTSHAADWQRKKELLALFDQMDEDGKIQIVMNAWSRVHRSTDKGRGNLCS